MISFSQLGNLGRLGNQLFQYAYLRSQANRMGVEYACPGWAGDSLFDLGESKRRVSADACSFEYREPKSYCGYNQSAVEIADDTDVWGFFQTPRYFGMDALKWYSFPQSKIYPELSHCVGIHLRFGDYLDLTHVYTPLKRQYYARAMKLFPGAKFAVFSDDLQRAELMLSNLLPRERVLFYRGKSDIDDFFAMVSCRSHIISNSSFAWWAAYLSAGVHGQKWQVVGPRDWFTKSWSTQNRDIYFESWQAVSSGRFGLLNTRSLRFT